MTAVVAFQECHGYLNYEYFQPDGPSSYLRRSITMLPITIAPFFYTLGSCSWQKPYTDGLSRET